jgi:hypothetical protein
MVPRALGLPIPTAELGITGACQPSSRLAGIAAYALAYAQMYPSGYMSRVCAGVKKVAVMGKYLPVTPRSAREWVYTYHFAHPPCISRLDSLNLYTGALYAAASHLARPRMGRYLLRRGWGKEAPPTGCGVAFYSEADAGIGTEGHDGRSHAPPAPSGAASHQPAPGPVPGGHVWPAVREIGLRYPPRL